MDKYVIPLLLTVISVLCYSTYYLQEIDKSLKMLIEIVNVERRSQ